METKEKIDFDPEMLLAPTPKNMAEEYPIIERHYIQIHRRNFYIKPELKKIKES